MIVPMKKVSLITLGDKKNETLKELRKLGILHISFLRFVWCFYFFFMALF